MKVGLNVSERLSLMGIMPKEDNFVRLKLIRRLVDKVGLSATEITQFGLKQEGMQVTWNEEGKSDKEMEFEEAEVDLIKAELKKLDEQKKLTQQLFTVFEKFVGA